MKSSVRQVLMGGDALPQLTRALRPTDARRRQVSAFVRSLKNAGLFGSVSSLYVRAAADATAAAVNWANPQASLTAVASPTLTADRFMTYNGSSQYDYVQGYRATLNTSTNLPDGPGGDVGKGFTCTGLYPHSSGDGTWWVSDDGRHTQGAPGTRAPAILRLSADFSTIMSTILLIGIYPVMGTIQGVVDIGDGTLWFASTDENLLRHVTVGGVDLGSIAFAGCNGLAYDAANACLITGPSIAGSNTVTWVKIADGTNFKTKKVRDLFDQLHFDPADGSQGSLYLSNGVNGEFGWVEKIDVASNQWQGAWILPQANAIEGIHVSGSTLRVLNDGYFHLGTNNQALTYSVEALGPGMSDRIVLAGTARFATSPAATVCLLAGGEPLGGFGVGLYAPVGGTVLRMILTTLTGASITINWTVTVTTRFSYWLDVDLTAKTAALYINGTLVSSQSIAAAGSGLPKLTFFFGVSPEMGVARFSNSEHSLFMTGTGAGLANARGSFEQAVSDYYTAVGLTVP